MASSPKPATVLPSASAHHAFSYTLQRFKTASGKEGQFYSLPALAKQAFLLAQLDGLTCAQIAKQLDVSVSTVERDLAKALQHCYRLRYVDA